MIPLRLEIGNFLSYRAPTTLDFHGLHLACISGPNGAGKSTILDAMTWALFGRSRSRSDDDVVNRQAVRAGDTALVDFSFELEGVTYRVLRSKKHGRPATLDFQMATPDGQWKSLSESGLRRTQAAIETLLKMNFDSFINASFLLQGKADEFTTKTANKRKEILADLLGVNEWDRFRDAAAERRKLVQNRLLLLDGRLTEIDDELAQQPAREAALVAAGEALNLITEQLALHEQILQERRRVEAAIEQQKQTTATLAKNRRQAEVALADLEKTLQKRDDERSQLQALLDQAPAIESKFQAWQAAKDSLEQHQAKADAYNEIQRQKRPHELQLERERSRLKQRQLELEKQARNVTTLTGQRASLVEKLQEGSVRLDHLSAELADVQAKEQAWQEARAELQKIQAARDLQAQELAQLEVQATGIKNRKEERVELEKKLAVAQEAITTITAEINVVSESATRLSEINGERQTLLNEQPRLKEKMQQLTGRIERLDQEVGGQCPLCGQELSDEHRQSVLSELRSEGKEYGDRYRQNQARIGAITSEAAGLEKLVAGRHKLESKQGKQQELSSMASARLEEIDRALATWTQESVSRLEKLRQALADDSPVKEQSKLVSDLAVTIESASESRAERERLQVEMTTIKAKVAQIDETSSHWETGGDDDGAGTSAELARITEKLEQDQISVEDQLALAKLDQQAAEIDYDPVAHQAIKEQSASLASAEHRYQELLKARAAVKPLDDSLADLQRRLAEQQATLQETTRQHEESAGALEKLSDGAVNLADIENKVGELREQQIEAHRREETAQQSVNVLDDLRTQRQHLAEEREELTQQIRRLQLLEKACGREGVQALLIERALPEIEDDANELLDRLSGGQMQVTFDTQRKLKTSDRLAETLDISIVDSVGERPYENYSGGEQFRVNFAIRLALSKVLTRRAGARLQTLVIDEGFGSQDPAGRQRLIEAINTVQDDFERVLVITHIDEMRDAFPNRIEVTKEPEGSSITVI